jgi:hypothetical protein
MTRDDEVTQQGHRRLAAQAFNAVWDLLLADRTPEETDAMVDLAHTSYWHWTQVAGDTDRQLATGSWQLARVYAVLGDAVRARHYGERSLRIAEDSPRLGAFNVAYAHEALARAAAVADDARAYQRHDEAARALLDEIADDGRTLLEADLANLPEHPERSND